MAPDSHMTCRFRVNGRVLQLARTPTVSGRWRIYLCYSWEMLGGSNPPEPTSYVLAVCPTLAEARQRFDAIFASFRSAYPLL